MDIQKMSECNFENDNFGLGEMLVLEANNFLIIIFTSVKVALCMPRNGTHGHMCHFNYLQWTKWILNLPI